jgi:hypothetical protein
MYLFVENIRITLNYLYYLFLHNDIIYVYLFMFIYTYMYTYILCEPVNLCIQLKNIQEWEDSRPYKGFMSIPSIDKELASEEVYTDVSAALCEAVKMSSSGPGPTPPLWVEGSSRSLFLSQVSICTHSFIYIYKFHVYKHTVYKYLKICIYMYL